MVESHFLETNNRSLDKVVVYFRDHRLSSMVTCRVCGASTAVMLPIHSEEALELRLLEKLLHATRLQLKWHGNVCFRCVCKIEDFSNWLYSVENYQDEYKSNQAMADLNRKNVINIHKTKKIKETYFEENVWKEHFTLNFSDLDEETNKEPSDEIIPNAQMYTSKRLTSYNNYLEPEGRQRESLKNDFKKINHHHNPETSADIKSNSGSQFSFLPSAVPQMKTKTFSKDQYGDFQTEKEIPSQGKKETILPVNISKNNTKNENDITFSFLSQLNSHKNQEDLADNNKIRFDYSEWNLQRTSKKRLPEQSKLIEEKNFYKTMNNARRKEIPKRKQCHTDELPLKDRITESKTSAKVILANRIRSRKVHDSVDIFASQSQECNNSKEMGSMDWQLAPDEDLIMRVRGKLNTKHNFY